MIEAMACGTPVLAFRCGSVPEVIDDGITGIVVETMEEAIATLPRVIALDRQKVRQRFEHRFSATRMAEDYVALYRALLRKSQPVSEFNHLLPLRTEDTVAEKLGRHLA
jgi:glycosyltransferase involved in cell wall biosynthesis